MNQDVADAPFWAVRVDGRTLEETAIQIAALGGTTDAEVIEIPSVGRMQMITTSS